MTLHSKISNVATCQMVIEGARVAPLQEWLVLASCLLGWLLPAGLDV